MQLGAFFPNEIGVDPGAIRAYAEAVEALGYGHIVLSDHVVMPAPDSRPGASGPYTSERPFHELFVLLGYLAAITLRVGLLSNVLILPQRQTALVAKQAAEVDVLSGGRLRLGIGVGWNELEFDVLGQNFHDRGARADEQIAVLRALWSETSITFDGRRHQIEAAGINPLPVRRSIPIWVGGHSEAALRRAARLGDGWLPLTPPGEEARGSIERLRGYIRAAGRDEGAVGIEARLSVAQVQDEASWKQTADAWRALGATHLGVATGGAGLASPQHHVDMLRRVKDALGA
jgi:probable F420-dependent oxidoreductase